MQPPAPPLPAEAALIAAQLRGGPPKVDAKELEGIVLLRRRRGFSRLDIGPFVVGYASITAALVYYAITQHWCVCCGGSVLC